MQRRLVTVHGWSYRNGHIAICPAFDSS
jgi:hypothetical protein